MSRPYELWILIDHDYKLINQECKKPWLPVNQKSELGNKSQIYLSIVKGGNGYETWKNPLLYVFVGYFGG